MKLWFGSSVTLASSILIGIASAQTPLAATHNSEADFRSLKKLYIRPTSIPAPSDNPPSKSKVTLGKILFFEPRLSGSSIMSCATCHNPSLSWGDGLAKGIGTGHLSLDRRSPTLLNLAWIDRFFWDGRAASLEEQALGPIESKAEMNMNMSDLYPRLKHIPGYLDLFKKAFPGESKVITKEQIGKAIATFVRTIVSEPAPFDRWVQGQEDAISEKAKRGFALFNQKARCVICHSGWSFTDGSFHDIGLPDNDLGRGKLLTKLPLMQHAFKTPTLRDVDRRYPYMHNGSESTLMDVIDFYNQGGKSTRESKAQEMQPLGLSSAEKDDLLAFLKTLTGDPKPFELPILPN